MHGVYDCTSPVAAGVQPAQKLYDVPRLAVAIPTAPPVVRDEKNCPKRVVAASLLTVAVLFSRDVVNCVYRAPRAASSIDRQAPSVLIESHVLGVAHLMAEVKHVIVFSVAFWA